ncbi:MAG TPA: integrase core domain-containing protein [Candidatus Duodenibacillus intestinavium]|nr:integrase core domain-containing protein [Candidatus Duodenibacillus intestinavium]
MPANGCFESRAEAQRQVQDWLLYYNGLRPHSKLQMKSPNEYYAQLLMAS